MSLACRSRFAGIATGNVYVGSLGSPRRQEHAVVGDTVNTAARLSGEQVGGGILCDARTYTECENKFSFKPMVGDLASRAAHNLAQSIG